MTPFDTVQFTLKPVRKQLRAFGKLLAHNPDSSERDQILPFFKANRALSAFLAHFAPDMIKPDRIKHEFGISGDFTCDLVVGDSQRRTYCFVEFEDATRDSIFRRKKGKGTAEWSNRFEHGFSQLVDWFYRLDDEANLKKWAGVFGGGHIRYSGILVLGRDGYIGPGDEDRLRWRSERVLVNTKPVLCMTYDKLLRDATEMLELMLGH